jgi:hypothetical protein
MNLNNLLPYFLMIQKIFFIALAIFYFIYALVVVKQVNSMSVNIKDKFNPILIAFSYIHLVFAALLIFLIIVWL